MKSLKQTINEKLKITKNNNHKEYDSSYKEMCDDLYEHIKFDGLCIVLENKRSHATSIYGLFDKVTYNNYRELMEDIYSISSMVKTKNIYLCPLKDNNPLYDYIIFSAKWIGTKQEFDRDYFEELFFSNKQ